MNEKFEYEINSLLLETKKSQKIFISITTILFLGNLALILLNQYNLFLLVILVMMSLMVVLSLSLKKRYTNMLKSYKTHPKEVLKQLEIYTKLPEKRKKDKIYTRLINAYDALIEQENSNL